MGSNSRCSGASVQLVSSWIKTSSYLRVRAGPRCLLEWLNGNELTDVSHSPAPNLVTTCPIPWTSRWAASFWATLAHRGEGSSWRSCCFGYIGKRVCYPDVGCARSPGGHSSKSVHICWIILFLVSVLSEASTLTIYKLSILIIHLASGHVIIILNDVAWKIWLDLKSALSQKCGFYLSMKEKLLH